MVNGIKHDVWHALAVLYSHTEPIADVFTNKNVAQQLVSTYTNKPQIKWA